MGYFGMVDGKCLMKFKVDTPDGYKILEDEIVRIDTDTLIVHIKKSSSSSGFFSKYVKVKM